MDSSSKDFGQLLRTFNTALKQSEMLSDSERKPEKKRKFKTNSHASDLEKFNYSEFESPQSSPIQPPQLPRKNENSQSKHIIPIVINEPRWQRGATLFVMNVNVGDRKHLLEIHKDDPPDLLAEHFCALHDVPRTVLPQLQELISHHKQQFLKNNHPALTESFVAKSKEVEDSRERYEPRPPNTKSSAITSKKTFGNRRSLRRTRNKSSIETPKPKRKRKKTQRRRSRSSSFDPFSQQPTELKSEDTSMEKFKELVDEFCSESNRRKFRSKNKSSRKPKRKRARSVPKRRRKQNKRDKNVYERLYKQHEKLKEKKKVLRAKADSEREREFSDKRVIVSDGSRRIMRNKRQIPVSARLYKHAAVLRRAKEEERRKITNEKLQEEERELTFHPEISQSARKLVRQGSKLWKRIIDPLGDISRESIHCLREQIIAEEMSQCSFHPKVNSRTYELIDEMEFSRMEVHDRLFEESLTREQRERLQRRLYRDCHSHPFQPVISQKSKKLAKHRRIQDKRKPKPPKNKKGKSSRRRRKLRDAKTGQELFKPKIDVNSRILLQMKNRAPESAISENLFSLSKKKKAKKTRPSHTFSPKLCEKSREISSNLNLQRHKELWKTIANHDESISIWNVSNLSKLPPRDATLICQMLNQLVDGTLEPCDFTKEKEPRLNFQMFCTYFSQIEQNNPTGPKHSNIKKKKTEAAEITFKPIISPKAQKMKRDPEKVFANNFQEAEDRRMKRERRVREKFEHAHHPPHCHNELR